MIEYRSLRESDLRATYEIRFAVNENLIHEAHVKYLQREAALADIAQGGGWICTVDGLEAGFTIPVFIPEPYLAALFVLPEYQRMGIGSELLRRAVNWFTIKGAATAYLETDANSSAERFYDKHGWKLDGVAELPCQNRYALELG